MGATQIREMAAQKIKKDAFSKLVLECTVANSMNSMNFLKIYTPMAYCSKGYCM